MPISQIFFGNEVIQVGNTDQSIGGKKSHVATVLKLMSTTVSYPISTPTKTTYVCENGLLDDGGGDHDFHVDDDADDSFDRGLEENWLGFDRKFGCAHNQVGHIIDSHQHLGRSFECG